MEINIPDWVINAGRIGPMYTALLFDRENKSPEPIGMNVKGYDWKQFVLNKLHWLSDKI